MTETVPASRSWRGLVRLLPLLLLPCAAPAMAAAGPAPPVTHFDVDEYRVEGNTLLPGPLIESAVYPFLGPGKTAADVERARAALDALYAAHGYATVSAELPRQTVTSGVIVFRVIERRVGRLRVVGSKYHSLDAIKRAVPAIAEGSVPDIDRLQREIVALNQLPGRTVTPELKPGRAPDTVDVDLNVQDRLPLHGSFEINNQQQVDTHPLRASASLSYDNLWQRGDSASVSFQLAPERPSDSEVLAASYLFRVPASDLSLLVSYTHSNSNVTTLGSTAVLGSGDTVGFRVQVPLWFQPSLSQTLAFGIDYKHYRQNLTQLGATNTVPLEYYPGTIDYQANWTEFNTARATTRPVLSTTDLDAEIVFGTSGLGANASVFDANRYAATPSFAYLRAILDRTQYLPWDLQAFVRAQGQVTADSLVPQEQLSLGGVNSVRGYFENEALVDYGAVVQSELRGPSAARLLGAHWITDLRGHVFFDTADGGINNVLIGQTQHYTLTSTGVGARVRLLDHLTGELDNAITLSRGTNTKQGDDRVLFRLTGDF